METNDLTYAIIGAAMEVHKNLGPGFLESIYRNALVQELRLRSIPTQAEFEVSIRYKDHTVGRHRLDLFVSGAVVVELKAIGGIADVHMAQVISYMKAAGAQLGLILNFGERSLTWKRFIRKSVESA